MDSGNVLTNIEFIYAMISVMALVMFGAWQAMGSDTNNIWEFDRTKITYLEVIGLILLPIIPIAYFGYIFIARLIRWLHQPIFKK